MYYIPLYAGIANLELSKQGQSISNHPQTKAAGTQGYFAYQSGSGTATGLQISSTTSANNTIFGYDLAQNEGLLSFFYSPLKITTDQKRTGNFISGGNTIDFVDTVTAKRQSTSLGVIYAYDLAPKTYLLFSAQQITDKFTYSEYLTNTTRSTGAFLAGNFAGNASGSYLDYSFAYSKPLKDNLRFGAQLSPAISANAPLTGDYATGIIALGHGQEITVGIGVQEEHQAYGFDFISNAADTASLSDATTGYALDGQMIFSPRLTANGKIQQLNATGLAGSQDSSSTTIQLGGTFLFNQLTLGLDYQQFSLTYANAKAAFDKQSSKATTFTLSITGAI